MELCSHFSNANFQDNNTDFSLTLVKLNPVLAMYNYRCDIKFSSNVPSQPYRLRDSPTDLDVDVMIDEIEGKCMESLPFLKVLVSFSVEQLTVYYSFRRGGY